MGVPPGQDYTTTITTTDISQVEVSVNGGMVGTSVKQNPDGTYTITIDGADIICPGPILIEQNGVILEETKIDC